MGGTKDIAYLEAVIASLIEENEKLRDLLEGSPKADRCACDLCRYVSEK